MDHIYCSQAATNIRFRKFEQTCCSSKRLYLLHIKKQYKNDKLKMITPTWNDEFELPECTYSVLGIHVYNEFIIKKHETLTGILNSLSINSYSCIRQ